MKNMADYCDRCQNENYNFDLARAPFEYAGEVVHIVHRLKYGGARYLAETFAQFMADTYFEQKLEADFVTFIPMYHKKEKNRGYNQAELIAKSVAEIIGLPLIPTLERVKQTTNFAKMNRSQRAEAVKGVYALSVDKSELKGKRVLLIDDVFTTGATVNECSALLKSAKCNKVSILTFATAKITPELY
jgi:ComF family protein